MSNDHNTDKLPDEREILRGRTFGLDDALAREASGTLKGGSPVAAHKQAMFALRSYLAAHLPDPEGSLINTLITRIDGNPPLVARHQFQVHQILRAVVESLLTSTTQLAELVRETDARWGREYDERPHFERSGQQPDQGDPYTVASVKQQLTILRRELEA